MNRNSASLERALKGLDIDDRLFERLLIHSTRIDGTIKPEGEVRISWIIKFVDDYGYSTKQIDIEVPAGRIGRAADSPGTDTVFADIVIFRDTKRTQPYIVMETKRPDSRQGLRQAESYARNLGAEYHMWHDGKNPPLYYKTARFAQQSETVGDIPSWVGRKPVIKKVSKTKILPSFRDENHMREVVHRCHELILEKEGHDPAKAFDELTKLLFLKLFDEREVPNTYEFMIVANDDVSTISKRLRDLFKTAVSSSRYRDVFSSKFSPRSRVTLELDDFTIFEVVKLLQGYSLINTTGIIHGADIKGTVFEQMVGNTFRGELAQFFTPRELVRCIVDILRPDTEDKVLDPACGSGGFLIMAIRAFRERLKNDHPNLTESQLDDRISYFAEHNLFGADINDRMSRIAKMNMIMHGDGHSGISNINGLTLEDKMPDRWIYDIETGKFSIIYSNPPFAGREKDPEILRRFNLGKNESGNIRSVSKEVLFVEMIIDLLKPGGRAGLVLPAGVFNNITMKRLRDYIRDQAKIIALIGLPHLAFQITGANNEGHLLFLEKVDSVPEDYDIFIDWASNVGIDSIGRKIAKNDLIDISKRFQNPPPKNIIKFSQLKDRIDPWHYHPNYQEIINKLDSTGYEWFKMKDVFSLSEDTIERDKILTDDKLRYIEKGNVDLERGLILGYSQRTLNSLPSRATYILAENDILFPDIYDSMRGIAVVPKEYAGYIATNRFYVVRHNPKLIILEYAYYLFTEPEILALLKRECSGEINPGITKTAFFNFSFPLPPRKHQEIILEGVHEIQKKKQNLYDELEKLDLQIDKQLRSSIPKVIDNYEDIKIRRAEFIAEIVIAKDNPL